MIPVPPILRSALLDRFPHGFTTRSGGVSEGPFASLNLGDRVGDDAARVEENWSRLRAATGREFARARQVHGNRVLDAARPTELAEEADAVLSSTAGLAACVSVADCVPILIADPESGAVAAVHAGWRGTLARVAEEAVRALVREHRARPERLLAAIGPSIGPCCYEVAPELAERFRGELGQATGNPSPGQARVDLWLANEVVLRRAGVERRHIDQLRRCSSCEDGTFFSHRRDGGRTGRQVGFIAPLS
ncbi:MAG TPA: peptidoglycan editing factor PgeF [Anaeromyxobacteraceae bacterium]|nr:peptidoglycan editing factor PgeF [Anaeromyxobacteraceae bacterium]